MGSYSPNTINIVIFPIALLFDGTLFWHVSFENHTRGVVFEKQKPSELSAIKCLIRLSISDTLLFAMLLRVYRFHIGFVTNYGLGAITLSVFDRCVFLMRFWFVRKALMTTLGVRQVPISPRFALLVQATPH